MILYINSYKININSKLLIDNSLPNDLRDAFTTIKRYGIKKEPTIKQKEAAKKGTQIRQQKAKEKIENAVNILRMDNQAINNNSVKRVSGCSINTVKKYTEFIEVQEKNKIKNLERIK
jgi:hypothetical protein